MGVAQTTLHRKLARGGVARSPLPDTVFLGQSFAHNIERGLRPLIKTTVSAMVLEGQVVKMGKAIEGISVPAMLGLFEIENSKTQGLLALDTELVFHLIDLTLGGDAAAAPPAITRTFTEIDMALSRMHQDALLAAFAGALTASFGRPMRRSIGIASQRQDITQVRVAPENVDVLVYNVALDIGPAARSGGLLIVLPLAMLDVIVADMKERGAEVHEPEAQDLWKTHMRQAAAASPVAVAAVLHRQRMPVSAVQAMRPGDLLQLPAGAIDDVRLLITQPGGKHAEIASGRLGAYQGSKVVKLDTPIDLRLTDYVRRIL